jgi:septum formation protein
MRSPLRLTLASGSRGRRYLLERAGYAFDVLPANVDEPTAADKDGIRAYVERVAWSKAAAVAPKISEGLVLAADTVGWIDGTVIGKPADADDARRILTTLGGREHELWTGAIFWRRPDDLQVAWQEVSRVFFRKLDRREMDEYLATRLWEGCSGAYAIQETDDPYVRIVLGSMTNVIGLPMETLERTLAEFFPESGTQCR